MSQVGIILSLGVKRRGQEARSRNKCATRAGQIRNALYPAAAASFRI